MRKILVLFVAGLAVATDYQNPFDPLVNVFKTGENPSVSRLDQGLDEFVQTISDLIRSNGFMEKYYPMSVPDVNLRFTANLPSKQYQGVWQLRHGKLYGLDHYYRYGDAEVIYDQHFYYIKIPIQIKDISFVYNSMVKIQDVVQEETVIASVGKFVFSYVIKIDRHNLNVYAQDLDIKSISRIDVKVKENNRIDQQINDVFTFDATTFRDVIVDVVNSKTIQELTPLADEINFRHA